MAKKSLRRAQQLAGSAEQAVRAAATPLRNFGFPYRAPTVPRGVEVPAEITGLGAHYDTGWARRPVASFARGLITEGPIRLATRLLTNPEIVGHDRLADLARLDDPPALIFAPTHHSHFDTGLMIRAIPVVWRRDLVVAAAADYFFDKKWKAAISALSLNAIPIDREVTGRASSDLLAALIADGHSLVIYPEGGRSQDGWGQEFKGGAAYLSSKTGAPVVPVFIDGTGAIFGKGMKRPKPGRTKVVFGRPMLADDDESTRRFNARIERAVTTLGDEALTDYWTARQRAATGDNPPLTGPEFTGWRRDWALADRRKLGAAGKRRRQQRPWPDLG
ncbi:MAG: 1-acyl-sn-glycerol-3-phosphate acyltransferase [Ilumatobacter sp.]|nr:1-acyl-sn-glycerol-3-phosphate acyltransferase [Ilumatobacter sp.]